ncbi:MAG: glycosyltransferase family 4 protein [Gemmatimonadota bacterium]
MQEPRDPLRVLLVATSLDIVGGQAVQADYLRRGLEAEASVDLRFLPINPRLPGPLRLLQRIKYVRTVTTFTWFTLKLLWAAPRADVLHIFAGSYFSFMVAPAPALLVARILNKRSVLHYHDGRAEAYLSTWRSAVPLIKLADVVIAPSDYLVDVFARFGIPARCIYNVVALDELQFRLREHPRPRFLHNRGLEPLYDVPCTLRAFRRIQDRHPEAELVVANDGSQRAELEAMAKELGLNARFVGMVPPERNATMYEEADVYLMSPRIDNMPGSVLECYATGVPLVSTDAGGVPYIVEHERTGLLVPVGDSDALAAAALRLLEEKGLAARLTRAGHAELDKYRWPPIRDAWLDLYRELTTA